jgi:hypothetical protein
VTNSTDHIFVHSVPDRRGTTVSTSGSGGCNVSYFRIGVGDWRTPGTLLDPSLGVPPVAKRRPPCATGKPFKRPYRKGSGIPWMVAGVGMQFGVWRVTGTIGQPPDAGLKPRRFTGA